eukprot:g9822.t2
MVCSAAVGPRPSIRFGTHVLGQTCSGVLTASEAGEEILPPSPPEGYGNPPTKLEQEIPFSFASGLPNETKEVFQEAAELVARSSKKRHRKNKVSKVINDLFLRHLWLCRERFLLTTMDHGC